MCKDSNIRAYSSAGCVIFIVVEGYVAVVIDAGVDAPFFGIRNSIVIFFVRVCGELMGEITLLLPGCICIYD